MPRKKTTNRKIINNRKAIRNVRRRANRTQKQLRRLKRNIVRKKRDIPNAYIQGTRKYFRIDKTTANSMLVSGRDLVYKLPDTKLDQEMRNVLTVIPANPAYWQGTGISSIATAYQQYRPIKFTVHYIPIVDTSRSGTIFGGTLWNTALSNDGFEQALNRTPGALNTQFFKPATRTVRIRGNVNRVYNIAGTLDEDSNPFYYVAVCTGSFNNQLDPPGMFYVSYTYLFKNPIGNNTVYRTPALIKFSDLQYKPNTTAILCKSLAITKNKGKEQNIYYKVTIPLFAELQVDWSEAGAPVATYNGDYVPLEPDTKIWVFQNWVNDMFLEEAEIAPLEYRLQYATRAAASVNDPDVIHLGLGQILVYAKKNEDTVKVVIPLQATEVNITDVRTDAQNQLMAYRATPQEIPQLDELTVHSFNYWNQLGHIAMLIYSNDKQTLYLNGVPVSFKNNNNMKKLNAQTSNEIKPLSIDDLPEEEEIDE